MMDFPVTDLHKIEKDFDSVMKQIFHLWRKLLKNWTTQYWSRWIKIHWQTLLRIYRSWWSAAAGPVQKTLIERQQKQLDLPEQVSSADKTNIL